MREITLNTEALPETLFQLIKTDKVTLREVDGEIRLIPVGDPVIIQSTYETSDTPITDSLLGIAEGAGIKNRNDIKEMRLKEHLPKTKSVQQLEAFDRFVSAVRSADSEPLTETDFVQLETNRASFSREVSL